MSLINNDEAKERADKAEKLYERVRADYQKVAKERAQFIEEKSLLERERDLDRERMREELRLRQEHEGERLKLLHEEKNS